MRAERSCECGYCKHEECCDAGESGHCLLLAAQCENMLPGGYANEKSA
jgi:hypothetical protein